MSSRQPPPPLAGHLGHLTADEQAALNTFKELAAEEELYRPARGTDRASHDEPTLLRFLRARKFHVKDALKQFRETEQWRKDTQLDELYERIDAEEFEQTRRLYPQWTGRRDRKGAPVFLYEVKYLDAKTMATYEQLLKGSITVAPAPSAGSKPTPPKLLRLFCLYENLVRFVLPLCSATRDRPHQETPITQSSNIVDISGVGLRQFWNLRSHMQDASQLATAHYPETLDRIFILGAPIFFPTVWSWIKAWFDPITVSKIFILSASEAPKVLAEHIDPANIPKKYGGELDFTFGDRPSVDAEIESRLQWTKAADPAAGRILPLGPARWADRTDGALEALFVGSSSGETRREIVAVMSDPPSYLACPPAQDIAADLSHESSDAALEPSPRPIDEKIEAPPTEAAVTAEVSVG